MHFVVIEGLDGSGKSTQINLLKEYLAKNNIKYQYVHFPRTNAPVYGELIARFLRGELGSISTVDPYLVALLYAGDRNDAKSPIREWIDSGYFVLLDRYVISNIAFQCAKLDSAKERDKLKKWILDLEYSYNKLPVPDLNLFLDVPYDFTRKQLSVSRTGDDRHYLEGRNDIHEADLEFQRRVRDVYLSLENNDKNYKVLRCYNKEQEIYTPDVIIKEIINLIA